MNHFLFNKKVSIASVLVVILLGVMFRFINLENKVLTTDETITHMWISGYSISQISNEINNREITAKDLNKYQFPIVGTSWLDTLKHLEDQHPPLYYVSLRFWSEWLEGNIRTTRSFSALISLFLFPCIYWLCWELFSSHSVAIIAMSLIAISPFHLLYAQEARQYSLWSVVITVSSATLLRAIRLNTLLNWGLYIGSLILLLYTHLLSLIIILSQSIYMIIIDKFRFGKIFINYCVSSFIGILFFIPWLLRGTEVDAASWTAEPMSILSLLKIWLGNISRLFFDYNFDSNTPILYIIPSVFFANVIVIYSLYFLCKKTPYKISLFVIISLILVPTFIFIIPDILIGGRRSSVSKYFIPCYLGLQISISFLLGYKTMLLRSVKKKIWKLTTIIIILGGIISCVMILPSNTWWSKKNSHKNPEVAQIINKEPRAILISENHNLTQILSISYFVDLEVRFILLENENALNILNEFNLERIFIFNPSKKLRKQIEEEQMLNIQPVYKEGKLWKIN